MERVCPCWGRIDIFPEVLELFFWKCLSSLAFEGCQGECSKEWLRLEKRTSVLRFDDLHRLRTSCKGFPVSSRAESSDENGGRHSDSGGEGMLWKLELLTSRALRNTVKSYAEKHCAEEHQPRIYWEIRTFSACNFAEIRTKTSFQKKKKKNIDILVFTVPKCEGPESFWKVFGCVLFTGEMLNWTTVARCPNKNMDKQQ